MIALFYKNVAKSVSYFLLIKLIQYLKLKSNTRQVVNVKRNIVARSRNCFAMEKQ
jgi:hypothetical protein